MSAPISKALYPAMIGQLVQYGSRAYKVVETLRLAVRGLREMDVYTDGWPEFTTILAELKSPPTFCEDSHGVFTTDRDKCEQFLHKCEQIDWKNYQIFGGIQSDVTSVLADLSQVKEYTARISEPYRLMHMTGQSSGISYNKMELPSDFHSSRLSVGHGDIITSQWQFAEAGTADFVRFNIDNFHTVGVWDGDLLVGWYLQQPYGALGMLNVLDSHRGKGLGKYLVQSLSAEVLSSGMVPYIYVDETNIASVKIHEKCGYIMADSDEYTWTRISGTL